MRWRLASGRLPIGIDVAGRQIKAVQARRLGSGWSIDAAASIDRAHPSRSVTRDEIRRLADVLERQGFQGRQVVVAVPQHNALSAILELPPKQSGAPIEELSRFELAAAHRCDAASIETACWDLPQPVRPREGCSVMAVGCRHEDADALLDAFAGARLDVVALDVESCALARACSSATGPGSGMWAILNFGWDLSHLVVLLGRHIVYERVLPDAGMSRLRDTLIRELDLDPDVAEYTLREIGLRVDGGEDGAQVQLLADCRERIISFQSRFVSEMRLSVAYAANEYGQPELERLLMAGELAATPGFADALSREWGHPVGVANPAELIGGRSAGEVGCDSPSMVVALGLSQYTDEAFP